MRRSRTAIAIGLCLLALTLSRNDGLAQRGESPRPAQAPAPPAAGAQPPITAVVPPAQPPLPAGPPPDLDLVFTAQVAGWIEPCG